MTDAMDVKKEKKQFRAWKLMMDPALVNGGIKTFRFDGRLENDCNPVLVRDPRSNKSRNLNENKAMVLTIPMFEFDHHSVGRPSVVEVTITNLNDNVNQKLLTEVITKHLDYGLKDVNLFYHPITRKHLGVAHVKFKTPMLARACIDRLNHTSLMGQKLLIFPDLFAAKCKEIINDLTNDDKLLPKTKGARIHSQMTPKEKATSNTAECYPLKRGMLIK